MKAVMIGGGLAGTIAAKTLRELDPEAGIIVLDGEKYAYYPRPNLIEFIAGNLPYEKMFAFASGWSDRQRINIRKGVAAVKIDPAGKKVRTSDGEEIAYDTLLLATGARPSVPAIPGRDLPGVFVLRTIDDAQAILARLPSTGRAAVMGGGLLGLEIARALRARGAEVSVAEFFDRLLPRQLDAAGSALLKRQVEALGIEVRLGVKTTAILGKGSVEGLKFEGGGEFKAGLVVVATGVAPETALAAEAGIGTGRGILVDDLMRTNVPDIFAAGDCVEHRGRVYGIIPASFEQGRAAAYNMLKMDKPYSGTVPSTTLKTAGLFVTSAGLFDTDDAAFEILVNDSPEKGTYRKIVLKDGRLVGAIWMGGRKGSAEISRLVMSGSDVKDFKNDLLRDDFDLTELQ